jgi:hypothetical protein
MMKINANPAGMVKAAAGVIAVAVVGLGAGGVALASTPSTPNVVVAPQVFVASHNGAIFVPFFSATTLGHLSLPAGSYTVTAKAWMQSQAGTGNSSVFCKLTLGGTSDQGQADAQDGNASTGTEPVRNEMMNLSVTNRIGHAGKVLLTCRNFGGGDTFLKFIKITAVTVRKITKTTF